MNLDVRLLDYKNLDGAWDGQFDAVIANGSISDTDDKERP